MPEMSIEQAFDLAVQHQQRGQWPAAQAICRQILDQHPNFPDVLHLLGMIEFHNGRLDQALQLVERAISLDARQPGIYSNLGVILLALGRTDEAIAAYRQAVAAWPSEAGIYNNLGIALRAKGRYEDAIAEYRHALARNPGYAEAHNNLGNALKDLGRLAEAIDAYRRALTLKPDYAEAHHNLGLALLRQDQFPQAAAAFRQAMALRPQYADACNGLGSALLGQDKIEEAIAAFRQALVFKPDYAEGFYNLGTGLLHKGDPDAAIVALEKALALRPDYVDAHNNLAMAFNESGQVEKALASYDRALSLRPDDALIHSNRVYTLHFHLPYDAAALLHESRQWNDRHARPLRDSIRPHDNDRSPDRPLRIGYVSPYFKYQAECFFMMPLLQRHHHAEFRIYGYCDVARPDAMTERLRDRADVWRNIVGQSDEQVAQLVRSDKIDVLVDLTMHMESNRLLVFARKPAPVQVTWLAYPGGTGLETMDYRLSDSWLDPPGADPGYTEKTIRLPGGWCCYDPLSELSFAAIRRPGPIRFGSLNHPRKLNDKVLELWYRLLREVPDSRLLLLIISPSQRQRILDLAKEHEIGADRLEFVERLGREPYLKTYDSIDIALDPLPYNGITTTCDALWMGVPVITQIGVTAAGRAGLSLLHVVGLPDLAAAAPEQFVHIARNLTGDATRLAELRATLRQRISNSPLMDAARFARNMEAVYRDIWRRWCAAGE
jgi:predicted O-linked N-acetylglucosamine transferase (SPINDLY family)